MSLRTGHTAEMEWPAEDTGFLRSMAVIVVSEIGASEQTGRGRELKRIAGDKTFLLAGMLLLYRTSTRLSLFKLSSR